MKLKAKKTTSNPCLVRHTESDGGYLDTFHVEGGDVIELDLDDYEVVDPEGLEFVGIQGEIYKVAYQPEPIETPALQWEASTNKGDLVYFDQEVVGWMRQVTKAINKLQEDR